MFALLAFSLYYFARKPLDSSVEPTSSKTEQ
jgi:hypothetical protein